MGSETIEKAVRVSRSIRTKMAAGLFIAIVLAACYKVLLHKQLSLVQTQNITEEGNPVYIKLPSSDPLDLSKFSNCTLRPPSEPRPKDEWTSQTIWVATPNYALTEPMHKLLINQLTGLAAGGKSFYASTRGQLRHCVGTTETATCTISSVPNKSGFHSKYMYAIRNMKTLFPFSVNSKGILYHNLIGQTPIDQWRKMRDEYMEKVMGEWVSDIKDWMQTDYEVGLYIVYEDLMDVEKGPGVVRKMANLLREAGFNVVDDDQIPCVWYNSIGEEHIQEYHKYNNYDFGDYIPGFTKDQQELMISSLEDFIADIKDDDKELVKILERYVNDIRTGTIMDEKWENKTLSDE